MSRRKATPASNSDNSVTVAVIGAVSVVAAALITYVFGPAVLKSLEKTPTALPINETTALTTSSSGTDTLIEDFLQESQYWETGIKDAGHRTATRSVVDGVFRWQVIAKQDNIATGIGSKLPPISDFDLETTLKLIEGPPSLRYGVVFRDSAAGRYYFMINRKGEYLFQKYDEISDKWIDLIPWTESASINLNSENMLRVYAVGMKIRLYVNDVLVGDWNDDSFSSGKIDIVAWFDEAANMTIDMRTFKVALLSP